MYFKPGSWSKQKTFRLDLRYSLNHAGRKKKSWIGYKTLYFAAWVNEKAFKVDLSYTLNHAARVNKNAFELLWPIFTTHRLILV